MKSFKGIASIGFLLLILAVPVRAQFGLPVAESFEARETGYLDFTAGAMMSEDLKCYAIRDTIGVLEDLRLFVDLGMADVKRNDDDLAVQAGLIYCLPIDVPVDLGLRASGYWFNGNVNEYTGGTLLLLASGNPVFEGLYVYGGSGVDYRNTKIDFTELNLASTTYPQGLDDSEDTFRLVATLGALMPMTEHLWFFAEATYDDDPFLSLGIRTR
jgi:hypothetical protein